MCIICLLAVCEDHLLPCRSNQIQQCPFWSISVVNIFNGLYFFVFAYLNNKSRLNITTLHMRVAWKIFLGHLSFFLKPWAFCVFCENVIIVIRHFLLCLHSWSVCLITAFVLSYCSRQKFNAEVLHQRYFMRYLTKGFWQKEVHCSVQSSVLPFA